MILNPFKYEMNSSPLKLLRAFPRIEKATSKRRRNDIDFSERINTINALKTADVGRKEPLFVRIFIEYQENGK